MPTLAQKYENDKFDISNMPAADIVLTDSLPIADASASNVSRKIMLSKLISIAYPCQGRLTLESGVPVSVADQTAKTNVYFTPINGNCVALYDGTRWNLYLFSELTLSLASYTANMNYDIWIYNNAGTVTLDSTVWTNDTTRATNLNAVDNVYIKNGDSTRRYLGTIRITGTTGQCEDSETSRYVWNYYNQFARSGRHYNTTSSWAYTTTVWREANGGTGQVRFKFVIGVSSVTVIYLQHTAYAEGAGYLGSYLDATNSAHQYNYVTNGYLIYFHHVGNARLDLNAGYHYVTQTEYANPSLTVYGSSTYSGSCTLSAC